MINDASLLLGKLCDLWRSFLHPFCCQSTKTTWLTRQVQSTRSGAWLNFVTKTSKSSPLFTLATFVEGLMQSMLKLSHSHSPGKTAVCKYMLVPEFEGVATVDGPTWLRALRAPAAAYANTSAAGLRRSSSCLWSTQDAFHKVPCRWTWDNAFLMTLLSNNKRSSSWS